MMALSAVGCLFVGCLADNTSINYKQKVYFMAYKREVYRPCFSKEDLLLVSYLVSQHAKDTKLNKYLSLFLLKINLGVNSASFVAAEKTNPLDIGLAEVEDKSLLENISTTSKVVFNARREEAANKLELLGFNCLSAQEKEDAYNWYLDLNSFPSQEIQDQLESHVFGV